MNFKIFIELNKYCFDGQKININQGARILSKKNKQNLIAFLLKYYTK